MHGLIIILTIRILRMVILFPLVLASIAWTHKPFTLQDFIRDFLDILRGK